MNKSSGKVIYIRLYVSFIGIGDNTMRILIPLRTSRQRNGIFLRPMNYLKT